MHIYITSTNITPNFLQYTNFLDTIVNTKYFNENHIPLLCKFHNYMWGLNQEMFFNKTNINTIIKHLNKKFNSMKTMNRSVDYFKQKYLTDLNYISIYTFYNYFAELNNDKVININMENIINYYINNFKYFKQKYLKYFNKINYLSTYKFYNYLVELNNKKVININMENIIEYYINYYKFHYMQTCYVSDDICIIDFIVSLKSNSFFDSVSLPEACKYHNFKWTIAGNQGPRGMFSIYDDSEE
uniref:Uncharacterized protein n=1 Tax=viral metagenome TaxID=1070528 RepID=A0A6C0H8N2_9ZZZZ